MPSSKNHLIFYYVRRHLQALGQAPGKCVQPPTRGWRKIHDLLISRVPREISSHIFVQCLSTSDPRPFDKRVICQPLILGAVCQSWPRYRMDDPTSLDQSRNKDSRFPSRSVIEIGSLRPILDISFDTVSNNESSTAEPLLYPLIDLLNRHSSRWRSLHLFVWGSLFHRFIGDGRTAPILDELTLSLCLKSILYGLGEAGRFSLGTASPQPHFVKMYDVALSSVDIKWNNLTRLKCVFACKRVTGDFSSRPSAGRL
ncbi:hypothetical protein M413DRAFT_247845 [Hebeloma cylindrosporum]|uniref:F-box domain-containing protein n=1 Tax=Hebeloma cylindrosporum TaxID=76867 RepID=A0A0C2XKC7_HEBCY|nr:hypothetical protein M413DRAFT_247845 [Hebeloma cylindrosporum h7]